MNHHKTTKIHPSNVPLEERVKAEKLAQEKIKEMRRQARTTHGEFMKVITSSKSPSTSLVIRA